MSGFRKRRQPSLKGTQVDLGSSGFISKRILDFWEKRRQQAVAAAAEKKRKKKKYDWDEKWGERGPFWKRSYKERKHHHSESKEREKQEEGFDRQAYVTLQIDEQLKHETDPAKRAALEATKKKLHAEQSHSKQQEMAGKLASGWWGDHDEESRKKLNADLDEFFGGDWRGTGFRQPDPQIIDQTGFVDGSGLRDERLPEGVIAPVGVLPDISDDVLLLLQQQAATQPAPLSVFDIASILWEHGISASLSRSIHATLTEGTDLFEAVVRAKGSVEGALRFMLPQLNWLDDGQADLAGAARRIAEQLGISDVGEDAGRLMDFFTSGTGEAGIGLTGLSTQTTLSPELERRAIAFAELLGFSDVLSPVDNVGRNDPQSEPLPTDQEVWEGLEDALNRLRVASPDDYAALDAITQPLLEELKKENPNFDNIDIDALAEAMSTAFGYQIKWGSRELEEAGKSLHYFGPEETAHTPRARLLLSLLTSNLHSVASIEDEYKLLQHYEKLYVLGYETYQPGYDTIYIEGQRSLSALELFQERFQSPDGEVYTVRLGADDITESGPSMNDGAFRGLVPLPESTSDLEELHTIYLGSQMTVEHISHEMGHQLDRALYPEIDKVRSGLNQLFLDAGLNNLQTSGLTVLLPGRSSTQNEPAEWYADFEKMADLAGLGFANVGWNYVGSPRNAPIARTARAAYMWVTFDPDITQICFTGNDGNLVCYPEEE